MCWVFFIWLLYLKKKLFCCFGLLFFFFFFVAFVVVVFSLFLEYYTLYRYGVYIFLLLGVFAVNVAFQIKPF